MPVNKFGSSKIDKPTTNIIHAGGVSLSYLDRNFERKGQTEKLSVQGGNIHGNLNMFGILGMNGNSIRGLPNTVVNDDEAVSKRYVSEQMSQLIELIKTYVYSKSLITIWATENGALNANQYEWSFGDSARNIPAHSGFTMPANGRIVRISLNSNPTDAPMRVNLVLNGNEQEDYFISKPANQRSSYKVFDPTFDLAAGCTINFITKTNNQQARYSVIALLIEVTL